MSHNPRFLAYENKRKSPHWKETSNYVFNMLPLLLYVISYSFFSKRKKGTEKKERKKELETGNYYDEMNIQCVLPRGLEVQFLHLQHQMG